MVKDRLVGVPVHSDIVRLLVWGVARLQLRIEFVREAKSYRRV
jgi:hypothetical protein